MVYCLTKFNVKRWLSWRDTGSGIRELTIRNKVHFLVESKYTLQNRGLKKAVWYATLSQSISEAYLLKFKPATLPSQSQFNTLKVDGH